MQARQLLAAAAAGAALLASGASYAGADDGCWTIANGIMRCSPHGARTREAVKAELRNAQAAGEMRSVGELSGAPVGATVPEPAEVALTRSQVRQDVAVARAHHELPHNGDL